MGDAQSIPTTHNSAHNLTSGLAGELADDLAHRSLLFWETLAEMERGEIENVPLGDGSDGPRRTAKSMVAEIAQDDERVLQRLQAIVAGTPAAADSTQTRTGDGRVQEVAAQPWSVVEQSAKQARQRLVDFTRGLAPETLATPYFDGAEFESHETRTVADHLRARATDVRLQRRKVQRYCGSLQRWGRAGLRKLIVEQHDNLMGGMAGLTEQTMLEVRVCGAWTIRDVYAHVLGWNEYCARLVRYWPEPEPQTIGEWKWLENDTMAAFNDRILVARSHLTMIEIADGLTTEYRRMMRAFDKANDEKLQSEGLTWGGPGVLSNFFYEIFTHEAEHAAQIWAYRAGLVDEEAARNRSDDS